MKKIFALFIAVLTVFALISCEKPDTESVGIPVNSDIQRGTVDYNTPFSLWSHSSEETDDTTALLNEISLCRYGSAGASLSQCGSAVAALKLSADADRKAIGKFFDGMNATQLDFFSFQWHMSAEKAEKMLSSPEEFIGLLSDSGNGDVLLSDFDTQKLSDIDAEIKAALSHLGVTDEWKKHIDKEPFSMAEIPADVCPLPQTTFIPLPDNCAVAVSFTKDDIYLDGDGKAKLDVTVYDYERFDTVDMDTLARGDIICIRGKNVTVNSVEKDELGTILINGGLDMGGYELATDGNGVYFEEGYSDAKSYYEVGCITLDISPEFIFTDHSNLYSPSPYTEPQIFYADDLLSDAPEFIFGFGPSNTELVIKNGVAVEMTRVYVP